MDHKSENLEDAVGGIGGTRGGGPAGDGEGAWVLAGGLERLQNDGFLLTRAADRPVAVFWSGGRAYAVDNRCPHMGFPMHRGTVRDGMITCHWHHARFDLNGGCAFDLFADDLPSFAVRVDGGNVYVAGEPRQRPDSALYRKRLRHGLEQGIGLIQAKSVVGLIESGEDFSAVAREIVSFGQQHGETWGDGLTFLTLVGNLWPVLSSETRIYALSQAARRVAANTAGQSARRPREALGHGPSDADQLRRWMKNWVCTRHRDALERTILTAASTAIPLTEIVDMLVDALGCRVYVRGGHTVDALNKVTELSSLGETAMPSALLALLAPDLAMGRGEEESSAWRNPIDLVQLIRDAEAALPQAFAEANGGEPDFAEWTALLWESPPDAIFEAMIAALEDGMAPWRMGQAIAGAAAMRLARFAPTNDLADWFGPVHAFLFANAICCILKRRTSEGAVKQLFHAAGAVYMDRFVNVPAARLPSEGNRLGQLPEDGGELRDRMFQSLDRRADPDELPALVVRYLQCGHDRNELFNTVVYATVREDLDFHKLQVWEAVWQQARLWEEPSPVEALFAGAARHLAAHCPTRRAEAQMTRIALRLHRGEVLHE